MLIELVDRPETAVVRCGRLYRPDEAKQKTKLTPPAEMPMHKRRGPAQPFYASRRQRFTTIAIASRLMGGFAQPSANLISLESGS